MKYLIIPSYRVSEVSFDQVRETGPEYLRYNFDKTKTFIKWESDTTPDCVNNIVGLGQTHWGPYIRSEFFEELSATEWNKDPIDDKD